MLNTAIALLLLSSAVSVAFGFKYLLAKQYMPYQAAVARSAWGDIPAGTQAIVLGMLKVIAAGLFVFGLSLGWLTIPLSKGESWAITAISSITAVNGFITLYVTTGLRKLEPTAKPPIRPTMALMLTVCVALVLTWFA
jgi:hypothetical protein